MKKIKELYEEFTSFESSLFRYSLSFSLLLALAPALLAFVMLFNFAELPTDELVNFVYRFLPDELLGSFIDYLLDKNFSLVPSIIALVTAFWLASRSVYSFLLISANHEAVDVPKWSIRVLSIIMFVTFALLIIAAVFIGTIFSNLLPFMAAISMVFLFTLMYRALSFRKRNMTFGITGAIFSTIAVMLTAWAFFGIVNEFTSYQNAYGPLASLVTLLLSIYVISNIIYFGFCLNIVYEEAYEKEYLLPLKHEKYFNLIERIMDHIPFVKKR